MVFVSFWERYCYKIFVELCKDVSYLFNYVKMFCCFTLSLPKAPDHSDKKLDGQ